MSSALWVAGDLWCSFILNSGLSLGFYRVRVSSSAFPGEISNPRRSDASLTLPVCLDALRWVSLQCLGTRHLAPAPAFFLQPIRTNPQDTSGHLFSTDTDFMQIKQRDRARRPPPARPAFPKLPSWLGEGGSRQRNSTAQASRGRGCRGKYGLRLRGAPRTLRSLLPSGHLLLPREPCKDVLKQGGELKVSCLEREKTNHFLYCKLF